MKLMIKDFLKEERKVRRIMMTREEYPKGDVKSQ
jgi:hypothetical protein